MFAIASLRQLATARAARSSSGSNDSTGSQADAFVTLPVSTAARGRGDGDVRKTPEPSDCGLQMVSAPQMQLV